MNPQTVSSKEFDEIVSQYNEWLASLDNPEVRKQNRWREFFQGMRSVFDIFGASSINQPGYIHPNPAQKDAIALASDWQRVGKTLDKVISGDSSEDNISIKEAIKGKQLVQQMYEHFRNVYTANA